MNVTFAECYTFTLYAECRYAECHYAECHGAATRGQSYKTFYGVNLLTLFCKLYLFIAMLKILLVFIKWSSLQKIVSKFTLIQLYEITLRTQPKSQQICSFYKLQSRPVRLVQVSYKLVRCPMSQLSLECNLNFCEISCEHIDFFRRGKKVFLHPLNFLMTPHMGFTYK
jgi:hypothetical protein